MAKYREGVLYSILRYLCIKLIRNNNTRHLPQLSLISFNVLVQNQHFVNLSKKSVNAGIIKYVMYMPLILHFIFKHKCQFFQNLLSLCQSLNQVQVSEWITNNYLFLILLPLNWSKILRYFLSDISIEFFYIFPHLSLVVLSTSN